MLKRSFRRSTETRKFICTVPRAGFKHSAQIICGQLSAYGWWASESKFSRQTGQEGFDSSISIVAWRSCLSISAAKISSFSCWNNDISCRYCSFSRRGLKFSPWWSLFSWRSLQISLWCFSISRWSLEISPWLSVSFCWSLPISDWFSSFFLQKSWRMAFIWSLVRLMWEKRAWKLKSIFDILFVKKKFSFWRFKTAVTKGDALMCLSLAAKHPLWFS